MNRPNVVIVDDSPVNIKILMQALNNDYEIVPFSSIVEGLKYLEKTPDVDLILLDIDMPGHNGYAAFKIIKELPGFEDIPIIFITARADVESEIMAFDIGIVDYIKKPIIPRLAKKRIDFQVNNHSKAKSIIDESNLIKRLMEVTIKTLISLADKFNYESERHINRIMAYVTVLSEKMMERGDYSNQLDAVFVEQLRLSAPFHDCGKAYISDDILSKPSRLTTEEFSAVQKHTVIGSNIMKKARRMMGTSSFYDIAEELVLNYHEKWDGTGYPSRIKGEEIPLCARIMAFADIYDALVTSRIYKNAISHENAVKTIMNEKGRTFDPVICEAFNEVHEDFRSIAETLAD